MKEVSIISIDLAKQVQFVVANPDGYLLRRFQDLGTRLYRA